MDNKSFNIDKCREIIDSVDHQIVELLDLRAQQARLIGRAKAEQGLKYYDPGRQRRVLQKVIKSGGKTFPPTALKVVFTEIMSACLALERRIRIGYFGSEATFTHQAAMDEFGQSAEYISYPDIPSLFVAVEKDRVDYSVVPIENSTGGVVHRTLDMFLDFDVKICNEIMLPVSMNLLSNCPMSQIKKIYSHPQGFLQTQVWLARNLPNIAQIEVATTVQGIQHALDEKNAAAIASEMAAQFYKIKILRKGIEDSKDNITRFWVLSHQMAEPSGNDKTSLMFSIKDKKGALHKILEPISRRGLNLTKIESRPSKRKAWEYVFFCDVACHISSRKLQNALKQIEPLCIFLKVLGSYPSEIKMRS